MAGQTVLFLNRDLSVYGGVGRAHLTYARHHDTARVDVSFACLMRPEANAEAAFASEGTPIVWIGDGYIAPALTLRSLVTRRRPSVIVCSSFRAYALAKGACLGLPCRVVYWLHSVSQVLEGPVRRWLFRVLSRSDSILCVSDAVRRAHGLTSHRLADVVYHGVEELPTQLTGLGDREEMRTGLGIAVGDVVVGYVAAFVGLKDHATLVRAFAAAAAKVPDLRLLLIGNGPMMRPTMDLVRTLGVGERVHMLGERDDVRTLLELVDIYAHPSRGEGFGLAVVEAMLAGLPVITGDEGAFPEYVHHGDTGLTSPGGDAEALARAIESLASDSARRKALGDAGRNYARAHFSPPDFATRFTELILRDLPRGHRAPESDPGVEVVRPRHTGRTESS